MANFCRPHAAQHTPYGAPCVVCERDDAKALARELAKALDTFGCHASGCSRYHVAHCDCGLKSALTRAREAGLLDKEGE